MAGIALGYWQLGRAQEKLQAAAVQARLAGGAPIHLGDALVSAEQVEHRPVEARGQFDVRGLILLDNRVRNGVAGYEVVMPLRLASGRMHVLVNRGWVAGTGDRQRLPEIRTPAAEVTLTGLAIVPGKKLFELSHTAIEGKVWQNLTIERYRSHMHYLIQPVVIQQTSDIDDGLVRAWPDAERGINVNRSYALQWFSLAALIGVTYLALSFRRDTASD